MRHRKDNRRLGRQSAHRKATLESLARAVIIKESIKTTKVKAKEAQRFIDRLITLAKKNNQQSKRRVFALIKDKELIKPLFEDIAPRFSSRSGGYTRVITLYPRRGDGSAMAILELIEKKVKKAKPKNVKAAISKEHAVEEKPKKDEKLQKEIKPKKVEKPERKAAPEPKQDVIDEIRRERAREEEKKVKKKGFFKNLRRYFRGKSA